MEQQAVDVPVWWRRWFQWMLAVLLGCAIAAFIVPPILALIYAARSVLLPVVLALVLAYIFNPIVTFLHRRARMPRWFGTTAVMLAAAAAVAVAMLLIVPPIVTQASTLVRKASDEYPRQLLEKLEQATPTPPRPATTAPTAPTAEGEPPVEGDLPVEDNMATEDESQPAHVLLLRWVDQTGVDLEKWLARLDHTLESLDWGRVQQFIVSSLDIGVGVAGAAVSFTSYLFLASVVTAFCFFFFSWKFNAICAWFVPFIPAAAREKTLDLIDKMDRSVAAFIRGRLIQATVMAVVLSVGWWIAGVPAFLLLGLASGVLNLVPFAAVVGFAAALALNLIDDVSGASGGGFTWWTILGPTIVYIAAQSLDGWVVEPLVQGKATDLDPVTVLVVVMLGGAVAGLLGMVLAIPVAACVKILSKEVLLPKLRALAASPPSTPTVS